MIVNKKNMGKALRQLEALKQEVLVTHLEEIDLDNEKALYDKIVECLVNGDLDNCYLSMIDDLDEDDKRDVQDLVHKNISLCFYDGDTENWEDSVDVSSSNVEMSMIKFLDNYNFLFELARDGGSKTLDLLSSFKNGHIFNQEATVNYLRKSFLSDSVFKRVIFEMSLEDSLYNVFTDEQKAVLCKYSEGTLYSLDVEDNSVTLSSPQDLAISVIRKSNSGVDLNELDFEDLYPLLKKIKKFDDIVLDINVDYLLGLKKKSIEFIQAMKGIDRNQGEVSFGVEKESSLESNYRKKAHHRK